MAGLRTGSVGMWMGKRALQGAVLGAALLPLMACNNFFQCENKPACPTTTTTGTGTGTSSTLDVAYVAYTTSNGSSIVTGYNLVGGALSAINSVTLSFVPIAMAVAPKDNFLYVASVPGAASPGIYAYAIGSDGSLSAANGGTAEAVDLAGTMAISPDGAHLYTLEALTSQLTQYTMNTSTGALSSDGGVPLLYSTCAPTISTTLLPICSIAVSPKDDYLWASLGTLGDAVFPYTSASGVPSTDLQTFTPGANSGDFSVAFDANDNAYLASTSTFTWFSVSSTGATTKGSYPYPSGTVPRSVVVDPDSKFVYTADVGTGKITGFTAASVTPLSGSPYGAPANVSALGVDSSDTYLVAVGYDATAGVQLYSIASSGVLSALAKTAGTSTQTQDPVLVAMTH